MGAWLLSFISGPIVSGLLSAYREKLAAGNTSERIAADLAQRELAVEQREAEVQSAYKIATVGAWYSPDHLLGYVLVGFISKVVVWDNMLGSLTHGNTDPIGGDVGVWMGWIAAFWLGKRGIENVARILKSRA